MPKVSIVLPTYNGEKYLKESLDSILRQTFIDWELIIVNDCSTDGTQLIINEYARRDNRIKVIINESNLKLPQSLNKGFDSATGEYLTWTSDDNYYLDNAIHEMVYFLKKNKKYAMVCARMEIIDEIGKSIGSSIQYEKEEMLYNNRVGACFMYRRKIKDLIGNYNSDFFLVEDYEYWLRILFNREEIGWIDQILYRYRYHGKSLSFTKKKEICMQLTKLRKKYAYNICKYLKYNIKLLGAIYSEMFMLGEMDDNLKNRIITYIPEFSIIEEYDSERYIGVYGAGVYGRKILEKKEKQILYFIDSDNSKIGKYIRNKQIKSFKQYVDEKKNEQLMIAVSTEKIGELVYELYHRGVRHCCLYSFLYKEINGYQ